MIWIIDSTPSIFLLLQFGKCYNYPLFYVAVKFLREITPYFKKTSSLSDIGWDDSGVSHVSTSPSSSTASSSTAWSDRKTIHLTNCYVCQNLSMIDKDLCTIEVHAPDGQSSCFIRCPDRVSTSAWFNSILMNVMNRMQNVGLEEANRAMSQISSGRVVHHMGWLAQQVSHLPTTLLVQMATGCYILSSEQGIIQ